MIDLQCSKLYLNYLIRGKLENHSWSIHLCVAKHKFETKLAKKFYGKILSTFDGFTFSTTVSKIRLSIFQQVINVFLCHPTEWFRDNQTDSPNSTGSPTLFSFAAHQKHISRFAGEVAHNESHCQQRMLHKIVKHKGQMGTVPTGRQRQPPFWILLPKPLVFIIDQTIFHLMQGDISPGFSLIFRNKISYLKNLP